MGVGAVSKAARFECDAFLWSTETAKGNDFLPKKTEHCIPPGDPCHHKIATKIFLGLFRWWPGRNLRRVNDISAVQNIACLLSPLFPEDLP